MKYCTYFTVYIGSKLPNFYIGSTTVKRIKKNYHGSVSSAEYKTIWLEELKQNPHLFVTFIIEYTNTLSEKLESELKWQKLFNVVNDDRFINKAYANCKFFTTPDSVKKSLETKFKNGSHKHSDITKEKLRVAAHSRPPVSDETKAKLSAIRKGRKHSSETISKLKLARALQSPPSVESRMKNRLSHIGKKLTAQHKQKISNGLKGRRHSDETKQKMSASLQGKLKTDEHKERISASKKGMQWYNNGELEFFSKKHPGDGWTAGRIISGLLAGKNGNAIRVYFDNVMYDSLISAKTVTGYSRYQLIKLGAIFIRPDTQNE